jgi:hypothetical protein
MEIYSHPDIQEIVSLDENSKCFDCGTQKPKWSSINNGIFLCLKCAGIHRNLGVNISLIRSLQIDSWDEKQILFLKKGGNEKLKNFLNEYNITSNNSIDEKYKSKASDYYRKNLRNEVEKELNPNFSLKEELIKPDQTIGKEIIDYSKIPNDSLNDDLISSENKKNKKIEEESFFGFVGSFFKNTTNKIVETTKDVSKKIEDLKIGDKIKATGVGAVGFIQNTKNLVQSGVQEITQKAGEGLSVIVDKTKSLINPNENNKKNEEKKEGDIKENNKENNSSNVKNDNVVKQDNDSKKDDDKINNEVKIEGDNKKDEGVKVEEEKNSNEANIENEKKDNEIKNDEENKV